MRTAILALWAFGVLGGALGACKGEGKPEGGGGPGGGGAGKPQGPMAVRVTTARAERVDRIIELSGTLGGGEELTIAAEVDAKVAAVVADLGDRVPQGGVLVELDPEDLSLRAQQADAEYQEAVASLGGNGRDPASNALVRKADADLTEAKRNLQRGQELMRRGLSAQGELDALATRAAVAESARQAALESAKGAAATVKARRAASALARKRVRDATIRSPLAGAVAQRLVSPGEYVRVGQPVAKVVVTDPLKLRGEVPERYVQAIKPGLPVRIFNDASPGQPVSGTLSRVAPVVTAGSRSFTVEALIPDPEGKLKPGLFARAEIAAGTEEVIPVPETAVVNVAGVIKVFVEEGGKARERKVQILRKRGGDALLIGELKPGERVILTTVARLAEGVDVKVEEGPPQPPSVAESEKPAAAPSVPK